MTQRTPSPPPETRRDKPGLSYRDAGVDIDAGNALVERIKPAVRRTARDELLGGLGGFGGLFHLAAKPWRDPVLVSGTDGVGTKLMLARMMGDHTSIGIDLVAMCVNDILVCGAEPLFFLDYFACGKLELDQAQVVIEGIADGCSQAGCALIGGETAEMPGMYPEGEYDLAGFAVGAVERDQIIDGSRIREGHHLLGLASSGPHSNGYSLIRKVIELSGADLGSALLDDGELAVAGSQDTTLGKALLQPTAIYARPVLELIRRGGVDGLAHITGGGLVENINRVMPAGLVPEVDLNGWSRPPVFAWLQRQGDIGEHEMLRTFNCGIGMVLVAAPDAADELSAAANAVGATCFDIGRVRTGDGSTARFVS
jgi:phosphoribosylformylglycinamidine cyclo-ligase